MAINKRKYNDYYDSIGGWHRVPNEIWEIKLDHTCKVIWCYLLSRDSTWDSSRNNIARNLELHRNTVSNCVAELQKHNMLIKTTRNGQSWDFEPLPPPEWVGFDSEPAQLGNRAKTEPVPSVCGLSIENVPARTATEPHPRRKEEKKASLENFESEGPGDNEVVVNSTTPLVSPKVPLASTLELYPTVALTDFQARLGDMVDCLTKLAKAGFTRDEVVSNLKKISKVWHPGDDYAGKKRASWISAVDNDLKRALTEVFPLPSSTHRKTATMNPGPNSVPPNEASEEYEGHNQEAIDDIVARARIRNKKIQEQRKAGLI